MLWFIQCKCTGKKSEPLKSNGLLKSASNTYKHPRDLVIDMVTSLKPRHTNLQDLALKGTSTMLYYPLPFELAKCMGPIPNSNTHNVGLFSKEFKETSMLFCNSIHPFFLTLKWWPPLLKYPSCWREGAAKIQGLTDKIYISRGMTRQSEPPKCCP